MNYNKQLLTGTLLASAFSCSAATLVIDSVATASGTVDTGVVQNTSVVPTSFSVGATTYTIDAGPSSTNQSNSNSTDGNLFWGATGTNPGGIDQALSDGDILSGRLNGQSSNFNFGTISLSDSFAVFFRGASTGFNASFDQLPTTVVLVDSTGAAITDPVSLPALATDPPQILVNAGSNGFIRGNGGTFSQVVGGYVFEAGDFVFTGGNTVSDAAGVNFPATAGHDPTGVFKVTAVPEPSTWLLGLAGSLGLLLRRRR